jgi:hypothetical protein|tara:strand:- start:1735 stop:1950 length:216 start_codon:yes stop_codon:yes gene_type:complete
MYIDKYSIEVKDKVWDEKRRTYKKEKEIVARIDDSSGIACKYFGKFLDDLSDNPTYRGTVTVKITIEKEPY